MNLDELYAVQSKERKRDSLQNLRPSFYQEVGEYIADLEAERERAAAAADDPFSSPDVSRLTDEIETARDVVEAIYERRMGKLVKQASLAAAGMSADEEGLTAEEGDLFKDLVSRIETNNDRVLDVLDGVHEGAGKSDTQKTQTSARTTQQPIPPQDVPAPDEAAPSPPEEPTKTVTAADAMGETEGNGASVRDDETASDGGTMAVDETSSSEADPDTGETDVNDTTDVDRVTVKITTDVGSILGVDDREYTLSNDDVVTLPEQNATPLLDSDVAEPLD